MSENELDWLASHLGHDIRVHRQYYRLQSEHLELAKISKLLLAAESGKVHSFAGRTLSGINFNDSKEVEAEDSDGDIEETSEAPKSDAEGGDGDMDQSDKCDNQNSVGIRDRKKLSRKRGKCDNHNSVGTKDGTKSSRKRGYSQSTPWTSQEKEFVFKEFHRAIIEQRSSRVGKKKCLEAKEKPGSLLAKRTWVQIKSCVKNIISKNKNVK